MDNIKKHVKPDKSMRLRCLGILLAAKSDNDFDHTFRVRLNTAIRGLNSGKISYNQLISIMESLNYKTNISFTKNN